jgi:hypothetical protein
VTTRADFTQDEWDSLVQLPRWVVAAASHSQRDLPHRTTIEVEAGLIASAHGRDAGNAFLSEVGDATLQIFDSRAVVTAIDFGDVRAGLDAVLERVGVVNRMLTAKADPADAAAYRAWLLAITDVVITAARSHDFLGIGGQLVTAKEHRFRDRLAAVLES